MGESAPLGRRLPKPLLIFDGDCHFCMRFIKRWRQATGSAVDYAPLQQTSLDFPEIPRESFEREVKLITPEGRVFGGAEAVFRSLNLGDRPGILVRLAFWMYQRLPGFAPVAEACYRFVARHRTFFSVITCWR